MTLCTFAVPLNCNAGTIHYPQPCVHHSWLFIVCSPQWWTHWWSTVHCVSATCPGNDTWLDHTLANSGIKVTVCNLILVQKTSFCRERFKDKVCTGDSEVFCNVIDIGQSVSIWKHSKWNEHCLRVFALVGGQILHTLPNLNVWWIKNVGG